MSWLVMKRKIQNLIARGVVSLVNDSYQRQRLQVQIMNGETFDDVERWQNYGHTSVPPKGAEHIALAVGGNRSNMIVLCSEDKTTRLKDLIEGDSALYHLEGHFLKVTENGVIEGEGEELNIRVKRVNIIAEELVTIDSPITRCTGDLDVDGKVTGTGGGLFAGVSVENHPHPYTDDGAPMVTSKPNKEAQ